MGDYFMQINRSLFEYALKNYQDDNPRAYDNRDFKAEQRVQPRGRTYLRLCAVQSEKECRDIRERFAKIRQQRSVSK